MTIHPSLQTLVCTLTGQQTFEEADTLLRERTKAAPVYATHSTIVVLNIPAGVAKGGTCGFTVRQVLIRWKVGGYSLDLRGGRRTYQPAVGFHFTGGIGVEQRKRLDFSQRKQVVVAREDLHQTFEELTGIRWRTP